MYSRLAIRRARGGFTLIELLVVVAIIALLAAFLFPVLAGAREKARQTTCLSQLRQISLSHQVYIQNWDERFPNWWLPGPPGPMGPFTFWPTLLGHELNHGICRDPSARDPDLTPTAIRVSDYALVTWGPSGLGTREEPYWCWPTDRMTLAGVVRPVETISVVDGATTNEETHVLEMPRHGTGMNVAFLDGHARWITPGIMFAVEVDPGGFHRYRYASADR